MALNLKIHCSSNQCEGSVSQIDEFMGKCDKCPRKCVLDRLKKSLTGEVDAEDETLTIDAEVIDQKFGHATASTHFHNIAELERKLFLLKDMTSMHSSYMESEKGDDLDCPDLT